MVMVIIIIIIIIKGLSLRRACIQPATNTQNSKPRPPTTNARSKGKIKNKIILLAILWAILPVCSPVL